MDNNLLKILKKIVGEIAPNSEKLVDLLYKKNNVNEFIIAKKLGGTINQTRNILYRLADKGLIEFVRKKDKKKGGWYTYYWTLKVKRILENQKEIVAKQIQSLQEQLKSRENERYYYCKNCSVECEEEEAMIHEFTCPECGEVLEIKDNKTVTDEIKKEIEKLERVISLLNKEIEEIEKKEQKVMERKIKLELKKKKIEKEKKKKAKNRLLKKKIPEKKIKKKKRKKKFLKSKISKKKAKKKSSRKK